LVTINERSDKALKPPYSQDMHEREGMKVQITTLHDHLLGDVRPLLLILLGAVGFVLLLACANVANLQLARAAAREKEFAVRNAIGAGRWRLARQLLVESFALAALGGVAGLLVAEWGIQLFVSMSPSTFAGAPPKSPPLGCDLQTRVFHKLLKNKATIYLDKKALIFYASNVITLLQPRGDDSHL
jgi:hypothetical protein